MESSAATGGGPEHVSESQFNDREGVEGTDTPYNVFHKESAVFASTAVTPETAGLMNSFASPSLDLDGEGSSSCVHRKWEALAETWKSNQSSMMSMNNTTITSTATTLGTPGKHLQDTSIMALTPIAHQNLSQNTASQSHQNRVEEADASLLCLSPLSHQSSASLLHSSFSRELDISSLHQPAASSATNRVLFDTSVNTEVPLLSSSSSNTTTLPNQFEGSFERYQTYTKMPVFDRLYGNTNYKTFVASNNKNDAKPPNESNSTNNKKRNKNKKKNRKKKKNKTAPDRNKTPTTTAPWKTSSRYPRTFSEQAKLKNATITNTTGKSPKDNSPGVMTPKSPKSPPQLTQTPPADCKKTHPNKKPWKMSPLPAPPRQQSPEKLRSFAASSATTGKKQPWKSSSRYIQSSFEKTSPGTPSKQASPSAASTKAISPEVSSSRHTTPTRPARGADAPQTKKTPWKPSSRHIQPNFEKSSPSTPSKQASPSTGITTPLTADASPSLPSPRHVTPTKSRLSSDTTNNSKKKTPPWKSSSRYIQSSYERPAPITPGKDKADSLATTDSLPQRHKSFLKPWKIAPEAISPSKQQTKAGVVATDTKSNTVQKAPWKMSSRYPKSFDETTTPTKDNKTANREAVSASRSRVAARATPPRARKTGIPLPQATIRASKNTIATSAAVVTPLSSQPKTKGPAQQQTTVSYSSARIVAGVDRNRLKLHEGGRNAKAKQSSKNKNNKLPQHVKDDDDGDGLLTMIQIRMRCSQIIKEQQERQQLHKQQVKEKEDSKETIEQSKSASSTEQKRRNERAKEGQLSEPAVAVSLPPTEEKVIPSQSVEDCGNDTPLLTPSFLPPQPHQLPQEETHSQIPVPWVTPQDQQQRLQHPLSYTYSSSARTTPSSSSLSSLDIPNLQHPMPSKQPYPYYLRQESNDDEEDKEEESILPISSKSSSEGASSTAPILQDSAPIVRNDTDTSAITFNQSHSQDDDQDVPSYSPIAVAGARRAVQSAFKESKTSLEQKHELVQRFRQERHKAEHQQLRPTSPAISTCSNSTATESTTSKKKRSLRDKWKAKQPMYQRHQAAQKIQRWLRCWLPRRQKCRLEKENHAARSIQLSWKYALKKCIKQAQARNAAQLLQMCWWRDLTPTESSRIEKAKSDVAPHHHQDHYDHIPSQIHAFVRESRKRKAEEMAGTKLLQMCWWRKLSPDEERRVRRCAGSAEGKYEQIPRDVQQFMTTSREKLVACRFIQKWWSMKKPLIRLKVSLPSSSEAPTPPTHTVLVHKQEELEGEAEESSSSTTGKLIEALVKISYSAQERDRRQDACIKVQAWSRMVLQRRVFKIQRVDTAVGAIQHTPAQKSSAKSTDDRSQHMWEAMDDLTMAALDAKEDIKETFMDTKTSKAMPIAVEDESIPRHPGSKREAFTSEVRSTVVPHTVAQTSKSSLVSEIGDETKQASSTAPDGAKVKSKYTVSDEHLMQRSSVNTKSNAAAPVVAMKSANASRQTADEKVFSEKVAKARSQLRHINLSVGMKKEVQEKKKWNIPVEDLIADPQAYTTTSAHHDKPPTSSMSSKVDLQGIYRSAFAVRRKHLLEKRRERVQAATVIQMWWTMSALVALNRRRRYVACSKYQALYRSYNFYLIFHQIRLSARVIQRWWRPILAKLATSPQLTASMPQEENKVVDAMQLDQPEKGKVAQRRAQLAESLHTAQAPAAPTHSSESVSAELSSIEKAKRKIRSVCIAFVSLGLLSIMFLAVALLKIDGIISIKYTRNE